MNTMIATSIHRRVLETGAPKERFLTDHWFRRDIEAVFRPRWHYAAHASELATPGSFVTFALGDDEVVICRTSNGELAAYYNVCPHRGHRLCTAERGQLARNFVCPYHGWSFSKDGGACVSATRMNADFDKSPYGLKAAWVEDFRGLIFVCLDDNRPTPVAELTEGLVAGDGIGGYDLTRMKVGATIQMEFAANWKLLRENDDECYHCMINHPELIEGYDPWSGFTVIEDLDAPHHMWTSDEWALLELGNTYDAKQVCAVPAPRTEGEAGFGNADAQFFWQPSGHVVLTRDHAWFWLIRPLGAERTLLTQHWLVAAEAEEGRDYDRDTLTKLFNVTMTQDRALCEEVQRGIKMRAYQPGPFNPHHQSPAAAFYRWYERCVAAPATE